VIHAKVWPQGEPSREHGLSPSHRPRSRRPGAEVSPARPLWLNSPTGSGSPPEVTAKPVHTKREERSSHVLAGLLLAGLTALATLAVEAAAETAAQPPPTGPCSGVRRPRNMALREKNLPSSSGTWLTRHERKWWPTSARRATRPVVAGGGSFVGTNNEGHRNPKITGDKGVLMAFNASDVQFLWRRCKREAEAGKVNDWPLQGICSTPHRGPRLSYVSNRD